MNTVNSCVYVCVCTCVYMCMCVCSVCVCVFTCLCICMSICVSMCVNVCMYLYVYVLVSVSVCVSLCLHVCVCICMVHCTKTLRIIASCFARIRRRCELCSICISRHSLVSNASRSIAIYTIWILGHEKLLIGLASNLNHESSTCMARA